MKADAAVNASAQFDAWSAREKYERKVGRCSRKIADRFLVWPDAPPGAAWLDLDCCTGAVTSAVLDRNCAASIHGVDPSESFVAFAAAQITDPRALFRQGDASCIPPDDEAFDLAVSGLALNFVPAPVAALNEMRRLLRPKGALAFYA